MRPIKFRAWDKENKKMIYNPDFVFPNYAMDGNASVFVLMQYTGLTDDNGKEIYEGDVVKVGVICITGVRELLGDVVYERGCFKIRLNDYVYDFISFDGVTSIEVVGNVYEHPELLEEIKRMGDDKE